MATTKQVTKKEEPKKEVVVHMEARIPYHPALGEQFDIDRATWRLLCDSVYPSAKTMEGIALAIRYCRVRNLDIMKRPVHVVPVYNAKLKRTVELVWPGIAEYRTTAARTGEYGGCDEVEEGPTVTLSFKGSVDVWDNGRVTGTREETAEIECPDWMRFTVYRMIKGVRCAFKGPKVPFLEIYSRISSKCEVPNDRWQKAPISMLEKCAEAAALRRAFPEEIGSELTAEEMEGKTVEQDTSPVLPEMTPEQKAAIAAEHLNAQGADQLGLDIADKAQTKAEQKPSDPVPPDSDWEAVLDEIRPGIEGAKNADALAEIMDENSGLLDAITQKAPQAIRDKFDAMVNRKHGSFK